VAQVIMPQAITGADYCRAGFGGVRANAFPGAAAMARDALFR